MNERESKGKKKQRDNEHWVDSSMSTATTFFFVVLRFILCFDFFFSVVLLVQCTMWLALTQDKRQSSNNNRKKSALIHCFCLLASQLLCCFCSIPFGIYTFFHLEQEHTYRSISRSNSRSKYIDKKKEMNQKPSQHTSILAFILSLSFGTMNECLSVFFSHLVSSSSSSTLFVIHQPKCLPYLTQQRSRAPVQLNILVVFIFAAQSQTRRKKHVFLYIQTRT